MAKIFKISLSLFAVLIVSYLGAHFWIRWKNTVHNDVTKVASLVACEPNEVRSLSVVQFVDGKREELEFERVDTTAPGVPAPMAYAQADWRYRKPIRGEADAVLIRRITSTACELYDPILIKSGFELDSNRVAGEPRSASSILIGVEGKGGARKISFEMGKPGSDRMIAVAVSDGEVRKNAKIPLQLLQAASLSPEQYQNLQVMRMGADNIQLATLKIDGKELFTLERLGADWKLIEGGKDRGRASEEANRFVNRLATLKAIGVMDPEYDASQCVASKAKAILEVRGVAGREESIRFDYGRGGEIATCSTARNMKFRVHRDLLKYLEVPAKSLAAK